jgi:hypothetical protein
MDDELFLKVGAVYREVSKLQTFLHKLMNGDYHWAEIDCKNQDYFMTFLDDVDEREASIKAAFENLVTPEQLRRLQELKYWNE